MKAAIKVTGLNKSFNVAGGRVKVLKDVGLEIAQKEFVVIFGPSGSGKSTLLHTILGLEPPDIGTVEILNKNIYRVKNDDELANFRKKHIGMVYQQANWVKAVNVIENVALPLMLLGENRQNRLKKAETMLKAVGMLNWAEYHPAELSSGQQQRVSLARALITNPEIIIADEPTGNLDFEAGEELMLLLRKFQDETGKTVLMVTHDLEYLKYADKAIQLFDGSVKKNFSPKTDLKTISKIQTKRKHYEEIS
jgi:putative ABC transport system ATP-binding protein